MLYHWDREGRVYGRTRANSVNLHYIVLCVEILQSLHLGKNTLSVCKPGCWNMEICSLRTFSTFFNSPTSMGLRVSGFMPKYLRGQHSMKPKQCVGEEKKTQLILFVCFHCFCSFWKNNVLSDFIWHLHDVEQIRRNHQYFDRVPWQWNVHEAHLSWANLAHLAKAVA